MFKRVNRGCCLASIAWLLMASASTTTAQKPPPIKPSSPSVVAPPAWSRVFNMPDGRTFVTDGGMSIDVRLAMPAKLPSEVLPPQSGKLIADRMTGPFAKEIALGALQPGPLKNSFITPDGIGLNGNYVNFLRHVLPAGVTRLGTKGKTDAVIVLV